MSGKPRLSDLRSRSAMPDPAREPAPARPSRLRWWTGWILGPGFVAGLIVGGGVWFGAHFPETWLVRFVAWVTGS